MKIMRGAKEISREGAEGGIKSSTETIKDSQEMEPHQVNKSKTH